MYTTISDNTGLIDFTEIGCGVWGWELELTILRQEEFLVVPACGGEFRSCIQCGVFVCCYDEELFPQAQIASLCSWGV